MPPPRLPLSEHVSDIRARHADPTSDDSPLQGFYHFCWPMTQGAALALG
jgi:hypothetical protein